MEQSNTKEICILTIILKHPRSGHYVSVVECGSRISFENSIKALKAKKIEIIFKHCESESELLELGITLREGFKSAEILISLMTARANEKLTRPAKELTYSKAIVIPEGFTPYSINNLPSSVAVSL